MVAGTASIQKIFALEGMAPKLEPYPLPINHKPNLSSDMDSHEFDSSYEMSYLSDSDMASDSKSEHNQDGSELDESAPILELSIKSDARRGSSKYAKETSNNKKSKHVKSRHTTESSSADSQKHDSADSNT